MCVALTLCVTMRFDFYTPALSSHTRIPFSHLHCLADFGALLCPVVWLVFGLTCSRVVSLGGVENRLAVRFGNAGGWLTLRFFLCACSGRGGSFLFVPFALGCKWPLSGGGGFVSACRPLSCLLWFFGPCHSGSYPRRVRHLRMLYTGLIAY